MKNNTHTINPWLLAGLALVMAAVLLAMVRYRHGEAVVPRSQCSEVYRCYDHTDGIEASFVKDYSLNDSVAVDITLLQASTDSAWHRMKKDFGRELMDPKMESRLNKGQLLFYFAPKCDYTSKMDTAEKTNNDGILCSFTDKRICVFHINNMLQYRSVQYWQSETMINNLSLSNLKNYEENN